MQHAHREHLPSPKIIRAQRAKPEHSRSCWAKSNVHPVKQASTAWPIAPAASVALEEEPTRTKESLHPRFVKHAMRANLRLQTRRTAETAPRASTATGPGRRPQTHATHVAPAHSTVWPAKVPPPHAWSATKANITAQLARRRAGSAARVRTTTSGGGHPRTTVVPASRASSTTRKAR